MISDLNTYSDNRGKLVPLEFNKLNFIPKRLFYVCDVPKGMWRGGHAHYKTQQLLICLSGKILVKLESKENTEEFILEKDQFCLVDKMIWDSQQFLDDNSVLLVLCSTEFDPEDYINDKKIIFK